MIREERTAYRVGNSYPAAWLRAESRGDRRVWYVYEYRGAPVTFPDTEEGYRAAQTLYGEILARLIATDSPDGA